LEKFEIRKILIPYDFSETAALALEHGVFMAKLNRAEITLLHIIETVTFTSAIAHAFSSKSDFENKVEESAIEKLQEIASDIHHKSGIKVHVKAEVGRIYKKIVEVSAEDEIDLILMGTHGVSGFQEFFMGSNAFRVVSDSPCPVITVQTHAKKIGFKDIVLPLDDSFPSRQKVPFCAELADKYSAVVHIAGLMTSKDEDFERKFKIKVEQVEEYLDKHGIQHTTRLMHTDNLAEASMSYAKQIDADLVVIMTEQEPNITGLFLGTYAQQVVNHSKIPVMSVRPAEIDPDKITVTF
jgi:nucleotide-binding universal stress UspA family protein